MSSTFTPLYRYSAASEPLARVSVCWFLVVWQSKDFLKQKDSGKLWNTDQVVFTVPYLVCIGSRPIGNFPGWAEQLNRGSKRKIYEVCYSNPLDHSKYISNVYVLYRATKGKLQAPTTLCSWCMVIVNTDRKCFSIMSSHLQPQTPSPSLHNFHNFCSRDIQGNQKNTSETFELELERNDPFEEL